MLMALVHAGSAELGAGRVTDAEAGPALVATILGAVTARHATDDSGDGPPAASVPHGSQRDGAT